MKIALNKVKKWFNKFRGMFPSKLPAGMTAFKDLVDRIVATYDPPCTRNDVEFVIATTITRLGPTEAYKSDKFFNLIINAAAAKQIAGAAFQELKVRQATEIEKQKAEATATPIVASSDDKPQL